MALPRLRADELLNVWADDRRAPMQIALLGIFDAAPFRRPDGALDTPGIRAALAARAHRVPALRKRVVWTRVGEGRPVWAADPSFDPLRHVVQATLPPGAHLGTWAANRVLCPLERDRPLWRAEVVDGLDGARFAVLVVLSHVLADGRAGMALAGQLLDPAPDATPAAPASPAVPPLPTHRELVRDRLQQVVAQLRGPRDRARGRALGRQGLRQLRDVVTELGVPVPATSLPRRVGPDRRLAVHQHRLEDLQRTGHALGVTLNDLLLTAVAGGLRDLLDGRGERLPGSVVRASVPAATGAPGGQVVGLLLVDLPVGEPDPLRRLALVRRSTTAGKTRLRAAAGSVVDIHLPAAVARPVVRWGRRFGSRSIRLSITDVTGPPEPLWLAGARLVEAVPIAPLVPGVPIAVAALSHAGALAVSVDADGALGDLDVLADGTARALTGLTQRARTGARVPSLPAPLVRAGRRVVEAAVDVDRDPAEVFALCSDPCSEPAWNPQVVAVQQLTAGPVGPGSRYRLRFRSGVGDSTVEVLGFDPPRAWTSTSTSARLDVRFEGEVVPDAGGSSLRFRAELRPRGALRPLAPVLRRVLRRRWEQDLATLRALLQERPPSGVRPGATPVP
ncbi:wax ester/triacylglycerol synthase domain-containing protein [Geodermatophilus sp. SYSU D01186]